MNWLILQKKVVVVVEKPVVRGVAGVWCFIVMQIVQILQEEHLKQRVRASFLFVLILRVFGYGLLNSNLVENLRCEYLLRVNGGKS